MNKKVIIFDFDGVIVNTFDMILSLKKELGEEIGADEYRDLFRGNFFVEKEKADNTEHTQQANDEWFKHYIPKMLPLPPVDGVLELIAKLSEDYALVVVSSTESTAIREYLEQHGVLAHFGEILGVDIHRSKVEKMNMLLEKFKLDSKDFLFVTDTLGDIKEANSVGIKSIGVTWGFHHKETLQEGSPFAVAETSMELDSYIAKWGASVSV